MLSAANVEAATVVCIVSPLVLHLCCCIALHALMHAGFVRGILESNSLDSTTLTLRNLFRKEFEHVAAKGSVPLALWRVLELMDELWDHSVQEVEGCNSLIKIAGTRCPNISIELLSARVGLKKATHVHYKVPRGFCQESGPENSGLSGVGS